LYHSPVTETPPGNEHSPHTLAEQVLATVRPDLPETERQHIASRMQALHGAEAVRHLLEVGASMDSLVVGEREIIRQLREAWDQSQAWGLTGDHLRLLTRFTIETAKQVYTHTGIGQKALSVVGLAFAQMQRAGITNQHRIMLVGAGQTNALFARFLLKHGYRQVSVFNRTAPKAAALAAPFEGEGLPLSALSTHATPFDALVVCTGATEAIITPPLYEALLHGDARPKVVIDLSVPNNVAADTVARFPMHYVEIEGLREAARHNLAHREQERTKAAALIAQRVMDYRELWHERQVERALAHVPDEVKAAKERAIHEVYAKEFARLDPAAQDLVLRMMGYLEKKCVAIPMKAAKAIALHGRKSAPPPPAFSPADTR
ncbi:MAG TPA: hypothetical protein PKD78_11645, partial [Saprospiraceae bacterium]|nr:hypothetical protein [Saprospiraceae bacterium]